MVKESESFVGTKIFTHFVYLSLKWVLFSVSNQFHEQEIIIANNSNQQSVTPNYHVTILQVVWVMCHISHLHFLQGTQFVCWGLSTWHNPTKKGQDELILLFINSRGLQLPEPSSGHATGSCITIYSLNVYKSEDYCNKREITLKRKYENISNKSENTSFQKSEFVNLLFGEAKWRICHIPI